MIIKVFYPSGNVLVIDGEWKGPGMVGTGNVILIILNKDTKIGTEAIKAKSAFIGDPRGVYQDGTTGKVLYNPRDCMVGMEKVWVDWLREHPEWPAILELGQA